MRETMMAMSPPLVLLAEDDADVRRLIATALRMDGYSVIETADGDELVAHIGSALLFGNLRGEIDPVSLVISDIHMPGDDGLEILGRLRAADIGVRVILITAHADRDTRERAARLGADAFLGKPFEIDELRDVVRNMLTSEDPSRGPQRREPSLAGS